MATGFAGGGLALADLNFALNFVTVCLHRLPVRLGLNGAAPLDANGVDVDAWPADFRCARVAWAMRASTS